MSGKCNKLELELYFTGELSGEREEELCSHLETCSNCTQELSKMESGKSEFLEKHPFSSFSRAHAPLKTVSTPWYQKLLGAFTRPVLLPVAGSLVLAVLLLPYIQRSYFSTNQDVRFKGRSTIGYIYERDGKAFQENRKDQFKGGDKIQIQYTSALRKFITLLSIDINGTISFYNSPSERFCSVPVIKGNRVTYPYSIELDNTPGQELVIALFSDNKLACNEIEGLVRELFEDEKKLLVLKNRIDGNIKELEAEVATILLKKE